MKLSLISFIFYFFSISLAFGNVDDFVSFYKSKNIEIRSKKNVYDGFQQMINFTWSYAYDPDYQFERKSQDGMDKALRYSYRYLNFFEPLPVEMNLTYHKKMWVEKLLGRVEELTWNKPSHLIFSYHHDRSVPNLVHVEQFLLLNNNVFAYHVRFGTHEYNFAREIVLHEFTHAFLSDYLMKSSQLIRTYVYNGKLQQFFEMGAIANQSVMGDYRQLITLKKELGFDYYVEIADLALLAAYEEIYADLVPCIEGEGPDVVYETLINDPRKKIADKKILQYRKFSADHDLDYYYHVSLRGQKMDPHYLFAPLRGHLWKVYQKDYSDNPQEFLRRVAHAIIESYEFNLTVLEESFRVLHLKEYVEEYNKIFKHFLEKNL